MKLIKIFTTTCGPCKVLEKNLQASGVTYESVDANTEDGAVVADSYGVKSVPTLLLVHDDGVLIKKHSGILTPEGINEFIKKLK